MSLFQGEYLKLKRQVHVFSDCGEPLLNNGYGVTMNGTLFGATAELMCDEGYNSTGEPLWTCTHNGWDGNFTCYIIGNNLIIDVLLCL